MTLYHRNRFGANTVPRWQSAFQTWEKSGLDLTDALEFLTSITLGGDREGLALDFLCAA